MTNANFTASTGKTDRAIVIGGGIAGLLAAKVLSEYYNEVLIVDRDAFPDKPENRPGTPQAYHNHRLSPRGSLIFSRYFPGFIDDLLTNGAPSAQGESNLMIHQDGSKVLVGQGKEAKFSRALLEWVIRKQVQVIPHIQFLEKKDVLSLQTSPDRTAVTGVLIQERGATDRLKHTLTADLVVDTSGRFSKTVRWLTEVGYDVPKPELLKVALGYSTRQYKVPSGQKLPWDVIRLEGVPSTGAYSGVFSTIENNIAEMLLWNVGGRYPSTDIDQFEREIAHLDNPVFVETLKELEPISTPRGYRMPELVRQHFDKMERWPSGFLVMGDAFCYFDPIYGQGMTVAAIEAEVLDACLRDQVERPKSGFELSVLKKMQNAIEPAWWLNCVADLRCPGVEHAGSVPLKGVEFAQRCLGFILKQAMAQPNDDLYGLYWLVNSVFVHPRELFNPQMLTALANSSPEGQQLVVELTKGFNVSLEERFAQEIPSFENASFASIDQLMMPQE
ncbi:NAD(P)/FAD-dependent oxidoreductase [Aureibacillus halotolerans]|uniref:Flavin-dependent dehydrogenase n=1 Tax=Aureibacillus halotolerans TaxID=1508390 RepID=A0A4R6U6P1_9BACI|nr:FAD dependent oxidoreductase [Aureibacillus halotolerans]TDQ41426.1 flavin-dependent dehydrogenase [Aureibacillus halotolerans]